MRVLIFNWKPVGHPAAGGAEVFTHEVARRWVARGHEVTVFCAAAPGRPTVGEIDGVRMVCRGGRLGVYRAAREFYRTQARGRFDLVIDEINTRPFGCARWVRDTPVVALAHQVCREIWFGEFPLPVAALGRFVLEPLWLRRYRDVPVLTVSPSSRDSLRGYGLRDVAVIPVGMNRTPRPKVSRQRHPTVVFVGRLAPSKRPEHALAAVELLRRHGVRARLWFVGDGPLRPRLTKLAARAQTEVRFFGRVSDAKRDELLARAHVLVVTSVREGWALVVDEAAAMGTPTIAYERPGLQDSVPAAGGVLVPPDPAALAAELAERLPQWTAKPATQGWPGGATDWDTVADAVLTQAIAHLPVAREAEK